MLQTPTVRRSPGSTTSRTIADCTITSGSGGVSSDCAITAWCRGGEPDQSECYAAADHHGPSMYTSGCRRMQPPQFAWQLPYPCGYGGVAYRCRPAVSGIDRQQAQSGWHPRVFPIAVSVALCSSVTPAPALRLGLPQVLSPPPPASDSSRVLNCIKLTSAPPSNNVVVVGLRGNGGTIWTTREGC